MSGPDGGVELPPDLAAVNRRAIRLEWLSIIYLISAVAAIQVTLGSSQAMKAALYEDLLSLLPPIAFLVAARFRHRPGNERFPYGYHRSVSIAFLAAALALTAFGAWILLDSVSKLIAFEHPPIGLVEVAGRPIWLGWLMLPALLWSAVPAVILGRIKLRLASELHDKVLYADAKMNKADWMTAVAAMLGVVGIGFGLWWADAAAAIVIALDIVHDGVTNVRAAVGDLMDTRPSRYDHSGPHPLPQKVEEKLAGLDWVEGVQVRMREEGHVFFGEALVVPHDDTALTDRIDLATRRARGLDWRVHDLVIMPVSSLPEETHGQEDGEDEEG
jgi:cation diffusion facilitator family transporter